MDKDQAHLLVALSYMWEQYCPPPYTHQYMTAGEQAEIALQRHGLLLDDSTIDQSKLEELEKIVFN